MRVVYLQDHYKTPGLFTEHCCNLIKLRCTPELGKVGQYFERFVWTNSLYPPFLRTSYNQRQPKLIVLTTWCPKTNRDMFSFHGKSFNLNIYIFQFSNTIENVKFEPNKFTS